MGVTPERPAAGRAAPLVGLARVVNAIEFGADGLLDFRQLAQALGMKRKEAAQFWQTCAVQLAPYMHQKLPTAIDVTGDSAGSLVVVNFGRSRASRTVTSTSYWAGTWATSSTARWPAAAVRKINDL